MPTSNSIGFTVLEAPATPGVGWEVHVLSFQDYSTVVAVLHEFASLTIGPTLNAPGEGALTMDADSTFWATTLPNGNPATELLEREYGFRCYQDGRARFEFLGTSVTEKLLDDDETRTVTIAGPGGGDVLRWAKVFAPGFPVPSTEPTGDRFTGKPIMWAYTTLFREAQARGTITFVTATFNGHRDSAGVVWSDYDTAAADAMQFQPDLGVDLLTLLNVCTGQDRTKPNGVRAEWVMRPGFQLDVRPVIGTHRENKVVFFEGSLRSKERLRTRERIANVVVVQDANFETSAVSSPWSIARYSRRESWEVKGHLTDKARRRAVADVMILQSKYEESQWTIRVPYDEPGRAVFVDYGLGDWIGISRYTPGTDSVIEPYRVLAITVQVNENGEHEVELVLESLLQNKQKQLELKITTIENTLGNVDLPPPPDKPKLPPYKTVLTWDYDLKKWLGEYSNLLGGAGVQVFIQADDPGDDAQPGDFWIETTS